MNALAATGTAPTINTSPLTPTAGKTDPLANEQTFLKLLVSQLKNQDPLNPPDTNQFVGQLTAYSQLEQLIGIRHNTTAVEPTPPDPTKPPTTIPVTT